PEFRTVSWPRRVCPLVFLRKTETSYEADETRFAAPSKRARDHFDDGDGFAGGNYPSGRIVGRRRRSLCVQGSNPGGSGWGVSGSGASIGAWRQHGGSSVNRTAQRRELVLCELPDQ